MALANLLSDHWLSNPASEISYRFGSLLPVKLGCGHGDEIFVENDSPIGSNATELVPLNDDFVLTLIFLDKSRVKGLDLM